MLPLELIPHKALLASYDSSSRSGSRGFQKCPRNNMGFIFELKLHQAAQSRWGDWGMACRVWSNFTVTDLLQTEHLLWKHYRFELTHPICSLGYYLSLFFSYSYVLKVLNTKRQQQDSFTFCQVILISLKKMKLRWMMEYPGQDRPADRSSQRANKATKLFSDKGFKVALKQI